MYRRKVRGWLKHLDFIVLDIICLEISFILGYYIRHESFFSFSNSNYSNMCLVLILIDLVVAASFNSFHNVLKRGYYAEFVRMLQHISIVLAITTCYLFAVHMGSIISRMTIFYMLISYLILAYCVRVFWKNILRNRPLSQKSTALFIITGVDNVHEIINSVIRKDYGNYYISGMALLDGTGMKQTVYD